VRKFRITIGLAALIAAALPGIVRAQVAPGVNWLKNPGFEEVGTGGSLPGGYTVGGNPKVEWVKEAHSGNYALALAPMQASGNWFRFPINVPGGPPRKFVFSFWTRTEFDPATGDSPSFYLHMSTPGFVGAGGSFPRTRFRYLGEWTHIGGLVTSDINTIGWFRFILYTTKPGLRIFLDDLFFAEVTGLPEAEIQKLLAGTTLTPKMELASAVKEETDYQPGNKFANSSFELETGCGWGIFGGGKLVPVAGGLEGGRAMPAERLWYQRLKLRPYRRHTFSGYFKAAAGSSANLRVEFLNGYSDGYRTKQAAISQDFKVTGDWQRYNFSFVPPANPSGNTYTLRLSGRVLADNLALEEGDLRPYQPARTLEHGISTGRDFNLFTWTEPKELLLQSRNYGPAPAAENLTLTIEDYFGREAWRQSIRAGAGAGTTAAVKIGLPDHLRGSLRALLKDGSGQVLNEQIFAVVPPPRYPGLRPESKFGALVQFSDANLYLARALGTKWSRDHWSFCWYAVEPKPGEWTWEKADEKLDRALKYGVSVFGVLHGTPAWASEDGSQGYTSRPRNWSEWETYVEKTVGHFKGRVRVWEVWNEPQSADFYAELCRRTYAAAKRADPDCLVIGLSSTLFSGGFLRRFVELGGLNHLDEVSAHFYNYSSGLAEAFKKYSQLLGGKPVWNTEGGGWGGSTFYSTRPDYRPERPGVQQVGHFYTTVCSLPEARFQCYYWNTWPADYNPGFEYSWTFIEHDSSLKPEGSAFAVTSYSLDGARPVKILSEDALKIHLFERGSSALAAFWWEEKGELDLELKFPRPAGGLVRDIMGNETPFRNQTALNLKAGRDVQFLEVAGMAAAGLEPVLLAAKAGRETAAQAVEVKGGPWSLRPTPGGETYSANRGAAPVILKDEFYNLGLMVTEKPNVRVLAGPALQLANENDGFHLLRTLKPGPAALEIEYRYRVKARPAETAGQVIFRLAGRLEAQPGGYRLTLADGSRLSLEAGFQIPGGTLKSAFGFESRNEGGNAQLILPVAGLPAGSELRLNLKLVPEP